MTDLILHIGLPKTGTTTIQSSILANRSNFLGQEKHARCLPRSNHLAHELVRLTRATLGNDFATLREGATRWQRACQSLLGNSAPSESPDKEGAFILSEEGLSQWPIPGERGSQWPITTSNRRQENPDRVRPAPIVRLLRDHGGDLWPHGRIRILLTLRNQADWLASHYSQHSGRIPNARQADFEARIAGLMEARDPFLDWSAWIEDLERAVGQGNVTALAMEEMDTPEFWRKLAAALRIGEDIPAEELASPNGPHANVRRTGTQENSWRIRPLTVKKALNDRFALENLPGHRLLITGLRKSEGFLWRPLARLTLDRRRESHITLDPRLRRRLLGWLEPANARLAERMGQDLASLGYFPTPPERS